MTTDSDEIMNWIDSLDDTHRHAYKMGYVVGENYQKREWKCVTFWPWHGEYSDLAVAYVLAQRCVVDAWLMGWI